MFRGATCGLCGFAAQTTILHKQETTKETSLVRCKEEQNSARVAWTGGISYDGWLSRYSVGSFAAGWRFFAGWFWATFLAEHSIDAAGVYPRSGACYLDYCHKEQKNELRTVG
jgi:hypothetical protein